MMMMMMMMIIIIITIMLVDDIAALRFDTCVTSPHENVAMSTRLMAKNLRCRQHSYIPHDSFSN